MFEQAGHCLLIGVHLSVDQERIRSPQRKKLREKILGNIKRAGHRVLQNVAGFLPVPDPHHLDRDFFVDAVSFA